MRARMLLLLLAMAAIVAGCGNFSYYLQSVEGQIDILQKREQIAQVLANPATSPALKKRLEQVLAIRDFASIELKLPDNRSYRGYADLQRPFVVWNVFATAEFSIKPEEWCFPIAGCVGYRGYFTQARADAFAQELRGRGLDVYVGGVPAYSTLGWFDDPVLNTFVNYPEYELARLIFHELAHQVAYAKGDTVFNESFATAVERIGSARWLHDRADPAAREAYERFDARRQDFRALVSRTREALDSLYGSAGSDAAKRVEKAELMARMQADYAALKTERWGGFSGYDGWFAGANNASFGVLSAYNELVPDFERLFEREGRDFDRFYAEARRLAALPKAERRAALQSP